MALYKAAEDDPAWLYAYGLFCKLGPDICYPVGAHYWKITKYYRDAEAMETVLRLAGVWAPQIVPQDELAEEYEEIMRAEEILCQITK